MSTAGLSNDRLARLRDILAHHVEQGAGPGPVSGVGRRGEAHVDVIGATAVDGRTAVRPDTIFRISSMTKPVTAVATLILLEECVLRLDEPFERVLPELSDRRVVRRIDGPIDDAVPANRPITVRDLLTFLMGFGGYFGPSPINDAAAALQLSVGPPQPALPPAPDEWMRRFSTLPLMCQPGERWLYNTGSDVLGVLIARASGQPFDVFLRERIFAPVGQYGWDGGLGTIWRNDPSEQMVTVLMTNAAWTSPRPPKIALDFLSGAYASIDD